MNKPVKYFPEVRERAVRMVLEHQDTHSSQRAAAAGCVICVDFPESPPGSPKILCGEQ